MNENITKHLIGGKEIGMEDYAAYLKVLGLKPFLSAREASTLFEIGLTRVQTMMKSPDANFVMSKGNKRKAKIHRQLFEEWLMDHEITKDL